MTTKYLKSLQVCAILYVKINLNIFGNCTMSNLKKNIDRYMQLKGIKMYSHLLIDIAHQLGINGKEAYIFAEKEKSNFSKMLKGQRPLKYEFIVPLEKIFGVSLARMLDENAYKLPVEKENVPFNKGFRYYAYLDNPDLYIEEFDKLLAKDGKSIMNNTDEFGKTFLDYVVEYQAVNGVRYLHDEYGISLKWYYNHFDFKKEKGIIWCNFENAIGFARLVASMSDAELFNDIYDSYNMFFTNGHYGGTDSIFYSPDYLEVLLDNKNIFASLFEIKKYDLNLGNIAKRKLKTDILTYYSINPILNNCLNYALKHLDKYKAQASEILNFGIRYNKKIATKIDKSSCYVCNELGGVKSFKDNDFYECVIIVNDSTVKDSDIEKLIKELPSFNRY